MKARAWYGRSLEFWECLVELEPENVFFLRGLSALCDRMGKLGRGTTPTKARVWFERSLEIRVRLVALEPEEASDHYDLACYMAYCGQPLGALKSLAHAVALGWSDATRLAAEGYLASLHGNPEFETLIERMRETARAASDGGPADAV